MYWSIDRPPKKNENPRHSIDSIRVQIRHNKDIPDSATSLIATRCSVAMKPSTEKMANPAYRLVQLLITVSTMQFLDVFIQQNDQQYRINATKIGEVFSYR